MPKLLRLLLLSLLFGIPLLSARSASAYVNDALDWHLVNNQPKRTIHYCAGEAARYSEQNRTVDVEATKPGLSPQWASWLTAAVDALNDANTGWTLVPSQFSFPPCQIFIVLADISEGTHGGGVTTPVDTSGNGKIDVVRLVIDSNLEDTLGDIPADQDTSDGTRDGWSSDASEGTRDPVGVLMHELMHGFRLDHHPDSSHTDTSDQDISDPRKPGDHNTGLSEEDIAEMRASSGMEEKVGMFGVEPEGQTIEFGGAVFEFPEGAFANLFPAQFDVNILDGIFIPDPLAIFDHAANGPAPDIPIDGFENNYSHILGSGTVYIRTNQPLEKPIKVTIPYTDEELKGGPGMYVGGLHGFIPPALDESSMRAFQYVMEPFGVEQEGTSHWELIENSTVNTQTNSVSFETQETGIFGIAAKPAEEKPGITALTKGNPVYILGGLIAIIAGVFFFKKAKKK